MLGRDVHRVREEAMLIFKGRVGQAKGKAISIKAVRWEHA